jgi:hypothetical protein
MEKPPYKVTIKLDGAKPEKINAAVAELQERAAEYDQVIEASATLTMEAWGEAPLRVIIDAFETYLFYRSQGIDCEIKIQRPGLRPETREMLAREKRATPMDREGWDDEA